MRTFLDDDRVELNHIRREAEMVSGKRILVLFLSLLMLVFFLSPLLAAEGMKVRMRVDGMI